MPRGRPRIAPRRDTVPLERSEQINFAEWLKMNRIIFYHIPNGGSRNKREAHIFKLMGVQPGVPDICIPIAKKGYNALYIELKRRIGGQLSENQLAWFAVLRANGNCVQVAYGFDEAIKIVTEYFG